MKLRRNWISLGVFWFSGLFALPATGAERQDVFDIGAPIPISRQTLEQEMRRNVELSEYIRTYGFPDYVEVQEVRPQWPWAAYEVRVYYLRRNSQMAFGRVNVAPSVTNYGLERFAGPIDQETLNRLLTAAPAPESGGLVP
jgi:hypothetical protein